LPGTKKRPSGAAGQDPEAKLQGARSGASAGCYWHIDDGLCHLFPGNRGFSCRKASCPPRRTGPIKVSKAA